MRLVRLQWGLALLLAIGLVGFAPRLAHAQPVNISQKVGVCDPKFPSNCIKPLSDGSININGGGGGGGTASFTAATGGSVTVAAGANKAAAVDTQSHQGVVVFSTTDSTAPVDWTLSVPTSPGAPPTSDTTFTHAKFAISSATDTTVVAGVAATKIYVYALFCTVDAADNFTFKTNATAITSTYRYPSTGGVVQWDNIGYWRLAPTTTADPLVLTTTTTAHMDCDIWYKQV